MKSALRKTPLKRAILWIALFAMICTSGALIFFMILIDGMCGDTLVEEKLSPNGWFHAKLVSRDCGATTSKPGYILHVYPSLGPLSGKISVVACSEKQQFDFEWKSNDTLLAWAKCTYVRNDRPFFILKMNP